MGAALSSAATRLLPPAAAAPMDEDAALELSALVEKLEGRRRRRFRRTFVDGYDPHYWEGFIGEDEYTEWRLRWSVNQMLDLLDRSPRAADVLLNHFLLNDPGDCKVVWFSNGHVILCEGPADDDRQLTCMIPEHYLDVWRDGSSPYTLTLKTVEDGNPYDDEETGEVLRLLHTVVALGTGISKVDLRLCQDYTPQIVPGLQDFVTQARSRRTVQLNAGVSTEAGRILAYHCGPLVELEARLGDWEDGGAALTEALLANQGPSRLAVGVFRGNTSAVLAPALAATTCVEELTIILPMREAIVWDAVVRNRGVQALAISLIGYIGYRDLKAFWKAALTNGVLHRIDASEVGDELHHPRLERDRRELSEMIATMIRSNPRITSIQYDPQAYDAHIMQSRVIPIVHLNKFRPIVEATFDDGPTATAAAGRDQQKDVSALIGSPLVRRHPELLYVLLKAGRDYLLSAPAKKRGRG